MLAHKISFAVREHQGPGCWEFPRGKVERFGLLRILLDHGQELFQLAQTAVPGD